MTTSEFSRLPKSEDEDSMEVGSQHAFEIEPRNEHLSDRESLRPQATTSIRSKISGLISYAWRNKLKVFLVLLAVAVVILCIIDALAYGTICNRNPLGSDYSPPFVNVGGIDVAASAKAQPVKPFRVLFYGDSLIGWPYEMESLEGKIRSYLPDYDLKLNFQYYFGKGIGFLKEQLASTLSSAKEAMGGGGIDAVILFWDTDASDTDWMSMSSSEKAAFREKYYADLTYVIKYIKHQNVSSTAIAGPLVDGEGPLFAPINFNGVRYDFNTFTKMYEEYRIINRAMCSVYQMPYIDVRQAFLDNIPATRLAFDNCLTIDGEHENDRGTSIVAKLFAETIFGFLNKDQLRALNATSMYVSEVYLPARKVVIT
jgi:hypothetical protein